MLPDVLKFVSQCLFRLYFQHVTNEELIIECRATGRCETQARHFSNGTPKARCVMREYMCEWR